MKVLRLLLYPFAVLYNLGSRIRNHLFDIGHKAAFKFDVPVISVGNLTMGGSGKTPLIEYLVELLYRRFQVVTLSRGYRRTTEGFRKAGADDTASTIGDEPLQFYKKYGDKIKVTVGEDRAFAIPHILQEWPETDVVLLDDAFQHRSVTPRLSILVTEFSHPFYTDHVLPFGRLREARSGARRADVIVVTKCDPQLPFAERQVIIKVIRTYAGDKLVFFSAIEYEEPRPMLDHAQLTPAVVIVTGIANADSFEKYCHTKYKVLRHFRFADHHRYTQANLKEIAAFCSGHAEKPAVLTTEKDMVRLLPQELRLSLINSWFYVPIRQIFIEDGLKFDELVLASVSQLPPPGRTGN